MSNIPSLKQKRREPVNSFYDIQLEIGRGSFSVVYKAIHKSSNKAFAVKVIDKKLGSKKLEMVDVEIALMQVVAGHENIIHLHEVFDSSDHVHIVMELISGGELFDKILELQYYSEKEASNIVKQLLSAIKHLHSKNIVHRDLKPENILLCSSEEISSASTIKLADFGLSTFLPSNGKLSKAVGTPGYIAPEILQTLDGNLDGYGKELNRLCGFPPFYSEDDDETFDQIIAGKFTFPESHWSNISEEAKDLINHLLVVDPKKRYNADEALAHPWIVNNTITKHLSSALLELKKFNAKKKWKKGMHAVLALSRMKNLQLVAQKKRSVLDKGKYSQSTSSLSFLPDLKLSNQSKEEAIKVDNRSTTAPVNAEKTTIFPKISSPSVAEQPSSTKKESFGSNSTGNLHVSLFSKLGSSTRK